MTVASNDSVTGSLGMSLGIDTTDPQIAGGINGVIAQATGEGASDTETRARISTLLHQFSSISQGQNIDAGAAIQAASQYVTQFHSIAGAIDTAGGLVSAVQAAASGSATPPDLVTDFTGPVIAALTTAGAVSAGVGAAIVGVVTIVGSLLDAANIFGTKPQGQDVCGTYMNPPPDFVINCVGMYDPSAPISPGSPSWRSFPEPAVKADAAWFGTGQSTGGVFFDWQGAHWVVAQTFGTNQRPIDAMFPEYARLYQESTGSASDFQKAFFTAWKANKQYWINGRKGASDAQVLIQTLRLWNRAHMSTSSLSLASGNASYISTLVAGAVALLSVGSDTQSSNNPTDYLLSGNALHMNTGPLKARPPGTPVPSHLVALFGINSIGAKLSSLIGLGPQPPTPVHPAAPPIQVTTKTVAMNFRGLFGPQAAAAPVVAPPPVSGFSKFAPFIPAVLGVVAFPFLGVTGPVVGGLVTVLWKEMKK